MSKLCSTVDRNVSLTMRTESQYYVSSFRHYSERGWTPGKSGLKEVGTWSELGSKCLRAASARSLPLSPHDSLSFPGW